MIYSGEMVLHGEKKVGKDTNTVTSLGERFLSDCGRVSYFLGDTFPARQQNGGGGVLGVPTMWM